LVSLRICQGFFLIFSFFSKIKEFFSFFLKKEEKTEDKKDDTAKPEQNGKE